MKRTPLQTTNVIPRKVGGMKQVALYKKVVTIPITGTNPAELQQVAAHIHESASNHPLVLGGKGKRKVYVQKYISDTPTKIFDGVA